MKIMFAIPLLLLAQPAVATGDAPFCIYSGAAPAQCFYYSVDSCQSAARTLGGMCSPNQVQARQAPATTTDLHRPNILGALQEGQERGARERRAQEEHVARLRLLKAQAAATAPAEPAPVVTYACQDGDDQTFTSRVPFVGCVVTDVQF